MVIVNNREQTMNERIRDLAEQAELPVIDGMWDYNDREILRREDGEWRVATPAEIISLLFACEKGREKFAELIIKECVNSVNCYEALNILDRFGIDSEHFGVGS
jgi:hypothetical protein